MSNQIVQQVGGELRASSLDIALHTGTQHKNVLELVAAHAEAFEDYGTVAFETRPLPGGGNPVRIAHLNEQQATLLVTFMRNSPVVVEFKKALVHEFYRMRQALAAPAPVELDRRALALMVIEAEDARIAAVERAVVAEAFKEDIELNDGLTVRDFHKKYFSEHREREVNEFFYQRGLLIDERNKRWDDRREVWKDGKNHRRPTYKGKPFFYLHSKLDRDKVRREETRVRPGAPELALVEYMTSRGFTANTNTSKELHLV